MTMNGHTPAAPVSNSGTTPALRFRASRDVDTPSTVNLTVVCGPFAASNTAPIVALFVCRDIDLRCDQFDYLCQSSPAAFNVVTASHGVDKGILLPVLAEGVPQNTGGKPVEERELEASFAIADCPLPHSEGSSTHNRQRRMQLKFQVYATFSKNADGSDLEQGDLIGRCIVDLDSLLNDTTNAAGDDETKTVVKTLEPPKNTASAALQQFIQANPSPEAAKTEGADSNGSTYDPEEDDPDSEKFNPAPPSAVDTASIAPTVLAGEERVYAIPDRAVRPLLTTPKLQSTGKKQREKEEYEQFVAQKRAEEQAEAQQRQQALADAMQKSTRLPTTSQPATTYTPNGAASSTTNGATSPAHSDLRRASKYEIGESRSPPLSKHIDEHRACQCVVQ